ncbi:hypothetical protein WICPIJ_005806 [Wickerhamomyces pijperi]|uniref:Uncharacterized protein n=1 Tax=Wickerhamomyces pijperi TaxID=599730 RepID=A0A9P8Q582_WICPI|nr:hypothetical protein WICPIJ_005806 [Wickerhamomyces pijperi]
MQFSDSTLDFTSIDLSKTPEESQSLKSIVGVDNFIHDIKGVLRSNMCDFFSPNEDDVYPCEIEDAAVFMIDIFQNNIRALHPGSMFNTKEEALLLLTVHFGLVRNTLFLNRGRFQKTIHKVEGIKINQDKGFAAKCFLCGLQLFQLNELSDSNGKVVLTLLDKSHCCSFAGIISVIKRINFREKDMESFIHKVLLKLNAIVNSSSEFDKLEMVRYYLLAQERNVRFQQLTKVMNNLLLESVHNLPNFRVKEKLVYETILRVMVSINGFENLQLRDHLMNLGVVDKERYFKRVDGIRERVKKTLKDTSEVTWGISGR